MPHQEEFPLILQKSPERSVTVARIVEAAAQLFARQGFKATTTREIAELAAVNEATMFRYFDHKPDIFSAAIKSRLVNVRMSRDLQATLSKTDSPSVAIEMIIQFMVDSLKHQPELVRLLHVATFEVPGCTAIIREHLGPIFDAITGYHARCAAKGVIGRIQPPLATAGLVALVIANQFLLETVSEQSTQQCEIQGTVENLAELWLRALTPAPSCAITV